MPPESKTLRPLTLLLLLLLTAGCHGQLPAAPANAPTNIAIGPRIIRSNVKRFGINLSGQTSYDSGQMLRDLTFHNPGFEGEIWQTVLQCKYVQGDSCADNDEWSGWPADFAKGGKFDFFYGAARGQSGIVAASTVAPKEKHQGVWINFGKLAVHPQVGDFYILRMSFPGDASMGWRTSSSEGAIVTTETRDISPHSPGKQALRIEAPGLTQSAGVTSDVDTWEGRSFLQLNGEYTLSFRAKGIAGNKSLSATVVRLSKRFGNLTYLNRPLQLTNEWQDFSFTFKVHEDGAVIGPLQVVFSSHASTVLLDDASLTESAAPGNPTTFRNAVVDRLRDLHPGVLRYMDNGTSFGSSIDNLLAPASARQRSGYSEGDRFEDAIPIGLHEFLVLCQTLHAEPWFVMPVGMTQQEARNLIQYLAAPASTPYGAKRAALGQKEPWTQVFPTIHLELGNETWNWGSFPGEGIPDPKAYATRVSDIFTAARAAPLYDPTKFDLVMNGWYGNPWWSEQELLMKPHADTLDIAPYTFFEGFNDASSEEAIFGPLFAEPEALNRGPKGLVAQNAALAAKFSVKLATYEVNLGTTEGKVSQAAVESTIPSVGAGISVAEHMLLMLRDHGIGTQNLFCLPEYQNGYHDSEKPGEKMWVKLWGAVIDMGGETNRVRPTFLAEKLVNEAISSSMLETTQTGSNPTWDQPESPNGKIKLSGAHTIQSFAFSEGNRTSLVLFNLSRTQTLPVMLFGPAKPNGPNNKVQVRRLTSAKITDSNEDDQKVSIQQQTLPAFDPSTPYQLPPYSMTVLTWESAK